MAHPLIAWRRFNTIIISFINILSHFLKHLRDCFNASFGSEIVITSNHHMQARNLLSFKHNLLVYGRKGNTNRPIRLLWNVMKNFLLNEDIFLITASKSLYSKSLNFCLAAIQSARFSAYLRSANRSFVNNTEEGWRTFQFFVLSRNDIDGSTVQTKIA